MIRSGDRRAQYAAIKSMANNVIPVKHLREWCRYNVSPERNKRRFIAKIARRPKLGSQNSLEGLHGTPEHGRRRRANSGSAADTGVQIGRLIRKLAAGEEVDLDRQSVAFKSGILDDLPTVGIPHEVTVERRFEFAGRTYALRGRMDADSPDGFGWEFKTSRDWYCTIDRINRSFQWRGYLWTRPELTAIKYCLLRVKRECGRPIVVDRFDAPVKSRYDGLEEDVLQALERFIVWTNRHYPEYWD